MILDESTAMLDPKGKREVMQVVKALNGQGITVLHITHDMDEAVMADRCIVFSDGEIVMEGPPREIFQQEDALRALGLDVPFMVRLSFLLQKEGVSINLAFTVEDMVEELCRLL